MAGRAAVPHAAIPDPETGRPARRGAALPAHERRVLLPLRAHRAVGLTTAADARLPVVPRRHLRGLLARGRRREPLQLRPGDLALVPHGEGTSAQRARRGRPEIFDLEPESQRSLRDPPPRRRRRAHDADLRRRALRPPGGAASSSACRDRSTSRPRTRRGWMDAEHAAADGRRGARAAPGGETVITRLADILVIQAIRSWIATTRAQHRLARRAARPADRPRDRADPPRSRARLDAGLAGARSACRDPRSPRDSPSWSASRRCSTSQAGACTWRATCSSRAQASPRQPAGLRVWLRGRLRARVQARDRGRRGRSRHPRGQSSWSWRAACERIMVR